MADPNQNPQSIQDIAKAWEQAKQQFQQLRVEVDRAAKLAQAKAEQTYVGREKDQALRDLGEAVWSAVQKGRVQLPAGLAPLVKAIEVVEARQRAQAASIADLLKEGEEHADRLKGKRPVRNSPVAAKPKKR